MKLADNIKYSALMLIMGLVYSYGCSFRDPQPYFFPPSSLKESEESRLKWKKGREKYVAEHTELSSRQKGLILGGVVGEGLTKEQTLLVYGSPPDKIETENLKYGADEMWFYRGVHWNDYFYFKKGVLIKVAQKR